MQRYFMFITRYTFLQKYSMIFFQDIPYDPTGDVDNFRNFIEDNADICKWVGIAVLIVQVCAGLFIFPVILPLFSTVSSH